MEIGLESNIPTYSGGLGVLAGDALRAAADLGVPLLGVTLLYRQGFFNQHLDAEGWQSESPTTWEPRHHLKPLDATVSIELEGRTVRMGAWFYEIKGEGGDTIPVYLLDCDRPENDPRDRALTGQLYGGDQRYRLLQEAVLGFGGLAMLRAIGYRDIETFHMNEGHCAFVPVGLLRERLGDVEAAQPSEEDLASVRERCVFTTHTPVPAGHDKFSLEMVHNVLGGRLGSLIEGLPISHDGTLNMTYLALFLSRFVNGVAHRHGDVAQAMYPGYEVHSITNGVHAATWASKPMAALYDRELRGWRRDNFYLRQALTIETDHLLEAHAAAKRDLMTEIERRTGVRLDPSVMTIGFARRAATYKRADLIFTDPDELRTIAREVGPLQFVFAGKAHPADSPGKSLIHRVFEAREQLHDTVPIVYLEEHDMALGRLLCSGVDLWLNNPQKPLEASGTSGMKAALNGVPSFSVLDGWWPEGWIEGVTGWSIGNGVQYESEAGDELQTLYSKLRYLIVPLFYGSPSAYARVMRSTIALNGAYFTSQRMMQQYVLNAYRLDNAETSPAESQPARADA